MTGGEKRLKGEERVVEQHMERRGRHNPTEGGDEGLERREAQGGWHGV